MNSQVIRLTGEDPELISVLGFDRASEKYFAYCRHIFILGMKSTVKVVKIA